MDTLLGYPFLVIVSGVRDLSVVGFASVFHDCGVCEEAKPETA
jgi:hypothetical protein